MRPKRTEINKMKKKHTHTDTQSTSNPKIGD